MKKIFLFIALFTIVPLNIVYAVSNIYVIKRSGTESGATEVNILDYYDNYQGFQMRVPTAQHQTGGGAWAFALGSNFYDSQPPDRRRHFHPYDIYAIHRDNTGTGTTEVHIIDGVHNFDNMRRSYGTALNETGTDGDWVFKTGNFDGPVGERYQRDIFAIQKANTGSGTTEVHILDGADNYQSFLLNTGTAQPETGPDEEFDFCVAPYTN
jgi:hypothetical protein